MVVAKESGPLPPWLRRRLDAEGVAAIARTIAIGEGLTRGEFVPMIVKRSIAVGHVWPLAMLGLWLAYVSFDLFSYLVPWRGGSHWWSVIDLSLLALLARALAQTAVMRRLLTASSDIDQQVMRRAEAEFVATGIGKTADATGVLLFVSLTEHRAVVLADRKIAAVLAPEVWSDVVSLMIDASRHGRLAHGMMAAIERCAVLVKPHFPASEPRADELPNRLIIKE